MTAFGGFTENFKYTYDSVRVVMMNATFNNISVISSHIYMCVCVSFIVAIMAMNC